MKSSDDVAQATPSEKPWHRNQTEEVDDDDDSSSQHEEGQTTHGNDDADGSPSPPSNKKKKKRKPRKKKKKKTSSSNAAAAVVSPKHTNTIKQVSFGDIRIRSFARSFYSDGVPTDGGWPLGFSNDEPFVDITEPISIEDYEIDKHARLEARWYDIATASAGDDTTATTLPKEPLETRQWDYKFGKKNPLFRALSEKARMNVIMGKSEVPPSSPKATCAPPSPTSTARRTRSNSDVGNHKSGNHNHTSGGGTRSSRRTRSGSYSSSHSSGRSNSYSEDQGVEFEARHVMQELEVLRTSRSQRGSRGCNCRKLHVYIPPPGSGKKAAHRRMKPNKLKDELRARNALPSENTSREDMEDLLLKLVQEEPCCGADCSCVENGIECQSETCSCWHAAANHVKDGTKPLACEEIQRRCGNPFGMVTVDFQMIDAYRAPYLTCFPVGSEESSSASVTANEEKKM